MGLLAKERKPILACLLIISKRRWSSPRRLTLYPSSSHTWSSDFAEGAIAQNIAETICTSPISPTVEDLVHIYYSGYGCSGQGNWRSARLRDVPSETVIDIIADDEGVKLPG